MTLDIRGSLKNTKVSANRYVVFEEMISNSIDAFLIRQDEAPSDIGLQIKIAVRLFATDLMGEELDVAVSCTDNGCGLGEKQIDAFLTKDTSYKDDLAIAGIGKCKGAGRIQFFHHFARVDIASTYRSASGFESRRLAPTEGVKKIELTDFTIGPGDEADIGTTIRLDRLKPKIRADLFRLDPLRDVFSAPNLRRHMLIAFLQRLVSLRSRLGDFTIVFETTNPDGHIDTARLKADDLPEPALVRSVDVAERDPRTGDPLGMSQQFTLTHYKLDAGEFDLRHNAVALCAKSSPAEVPRGRMISSRSLWSSA